MLGFFQEYTRFYKVHRRLFRQDAYSSSDAGLSVGASGIAANLMVQRRGELRVLHLVNHNYDRQILPRRNFEVGIDLAWRPRRVTMVSPDFPGERWIPHTYRDGRLTIKIGGIRYHDVILIE